MNDKNDETKEIIPVEEPQQTLMLFGTTNPKMIVKLAVEVADSLKPIIIDKKLYTMIHGKAYVWCEGWTLLGALLGGFPQDTVEDLSDLDRGIVRFNATCEVRTLNGLLITKAESECSNQEKAKKAWEQYALRSMAQTRATSKALRLAFGWIMKLAGYETTPAEEVNKDMAEPEEIDSVQIMKDFENELPKKKDESNKAFLQRQIEYLMEKLGMGMTEFQTTVKDIGIDSFGKQSLVELAEIMGVLFCKHKHGKAIKKIKTEPVKV